MWAGVGIFASAACHAATLPFEKNSASYTVILFGQVVALTSLCILIRESTNWEQAMTAAIVTAFVLPHFVLSASAVQAFTLFIRMPHRHWAYITVGVAITAALYALYVVMSDVSRVLFNEEPKASAPPPVRAAQLKDRELPRRVRFDEEM